MDTVISADGTPIAYERYGEGDPVILVVGAFNERGAAEGLARHLAASHLAITYDRRGRGDSGDGPSYAPEREVDDLAALIDAVGGRADVFGYSSGAVLALRAAASGLPIRRLALYEPPTPQPGRGPRFWTDLADRVEAAVAGGDRGGAVELFQIEAIGMPPGVVGQLRDAPFRPAMERLAHTLAYDARVLAAGPRLPAAVNAATLVAAGAASPEILREVARSLADALPAGELAIVAGVAHDIVADIVGPVVAQFLE